MQQKLPRFDGAGLAMLGAAALLLTGMLLVGSIRMPPIPDDSAVQNSVAWANWAMTLVSFFASLIGAASLYLIYRTMLAAQSGAEAAWQTVEETRNIGRAQTRAYLMIETCTLETELFPVLRVALRNVGQSPALDIVITAIVIVDQDSQSERAIKPHSRISSAETQVSDLMVGQGRTDEALLWELKLAQILREATVGGDSIILTIAITVAFEDVFGAKQVANASLVRVLSLDDIATTSFDLQRLS